MEKQQNDEQLEGKDGDIKMCKTELEEKQKEDLENGDSKEMCQNEEEMKEAEWVKPKVEVRVTPANLDWGTLYKRPNIQPKTEKLEEETMILNAKGNAAGRPDKYRLLEDGKTLEFLDQKSYLPLPY